jgi:hypothetical protein
MKTASSWAREHRRLGWLAVLHSALLLAMFVGFTYGIARWPGWLFRLWVGFVTLWFIWPVILVIHHGRSLLRFLIPVTLGVLFLVPCMRDYEYGAPFVLGLFPPGVRFSPRGVLTYALAYRSGRADAENDLRVGRVVIEMYGFPTEGEAEFRGRLRKQYQIELRRVAGDTDIDEKVLGHARGYNKVSEAEIKRRYGNEVVQSLRKLHGR